MASLCALASLFPFLLSGSDPAENVFIQKDTSPLSVCWFCCPHSAAWFPGHGPARPRWLFPLKTGEPQRYVFIGSIGRLWLPFSLFCLEVGDSEPGCLLQHAQFWTTWYFSVPCPVLFPVERVVRTCLTSVAEVKVPRCPPYPPSVSSVEKRHPGWLGG